MIRPSAIVATLLVSVLVVAGCDSTREEQDARRAARIQRELGLVRPYHLLSAGFVPDGGSGIAHFTDARGTPLWILLDSRMWSPGASFPQNRELRVYLNETRGWEGATALAHDSAAESAVVDLFESAIRSLVSVKRESTMLREESRALDDEADPTRWRTWLKSLTRDEENARHLRRMIARVEVQKGHARARRAIERIRNELDLEFPARLVAAGFLDDGGTGFVELVDAQGESLLIYLDNRLVLMGRDSSGVSRQPAPRATYLHGYPTDPAARRLEFGSPAESAVVDLLALQVRYMISAREESSLVRGERRARRDPKNPGYALSVWRAALTPRDRDVLALRVVIEGIDARRRRAGGLEPAPPVPPWGAAAGTPP